MLELQNLAKIILKIHEKIRTEVINSSEQSSLSDLSSIEREEEGDTIYAIDRVSEELLLELFSEEIAKEDPIVLIAEGLKGGQIVLPENASEAEAVWRIIVDPIDGTRGLMYQKRSAWILTGVAPNRGENTNLQDIKLAIQTEIPLVKQHLSDVLWAIKGQGAQKLRFNRLTNETTNLNLQPSKAKTISHGFAMLSRFFPGAREILAEIDEEIILETLGPVQPGKAHCFEDQYISTGGQLYELMAGHDRFNADLRPLLEKILAQRNLKLGICCHPYDICTELIAREMGVIVTDENGKMVSSPLSVDDDVSWIGYANKHIQNQIEPVLRKSLKKRNLL
jgi:fructose-1,6-bisphosphatase/inositol monophosphatase family enzyme